jgi:hypothetical protein
MKESWGDGDVDWDVRIRKTNGGHLCVHVNIIIADLEAMGALLWM